MLCGVEDRRVSRRMISRRMIRLHVALRHGSASFREMRFRRRHMADGFRFRGGVMAFSRGEGFVYVGTCLRSVLFRGGERGFRLSRGRELRFMVGSGCAGPRGGGDGRVAVVVRVAETGVGRGGANVLALGGRGRDMAFASGLQLSGGGTGRGATGAAVETNAASAALDGP